VVLAIGTFASYDAPARDLVLGSNLVPGKRPTPARLMRHAAILQQVSPATPLSTLRAISWTLSVCCGVTHALRLLPAWEAVRAFCRVLALIWCRS
jgi:hypothetical protein